MEDNGRYGSCLESAKEWVWPNGTQGNMRRNNWSWSSWPPLFKCVVPSLALFSAAGASLGLFHYYAGNQSNELSTNSDMVLGKCWNGTAILHNTPSGMTKQQEGFIMRAIEDGSADSVNGSTTEASSFISNTPQAESESLFSGSAIQEQFANTTGKPETGVAEGAIMHLGPETTKALKGSGGSVELTKCLVGKDVNVNAVDGDGCTMLNAVSAMNNTESVEFLVAQEGVDTNIACNSSYYKNPIGE